MKSIKAFFQRFGFNDLEIKTAFFIVIVFLVGVSVKIVKEASSDSKLLEFNYSVEDSLFDAAFINEEMPDSGKDFLEKKIASKHELLDFSFRKKEERAGKSSVVSKIYDLNLATEQELLSLPGIGKKTARAIFDYRVKNGGFRKIDELLNIKGIGKTKLDKIKNFIEIK